MDRELRTESSRTIRIPCRRRTLRIRQQPQRRVCETTISPLLSPLRSTRTRELTLLGLLLLLLGSGLGGTTGSGGSTGRSGRGSSARRDRGELGRTLSDQLLMCTGSRVDKNQARVTWKRNSSATRSNSIRLRTERAVDAPR